MQPPIVEVPNNEVVRGAIKATTGTTGKPFPGGADPVPAGIAVTKPSAPPSTVASAKPGDDADLLASPERFMPDAKRMRIKGVAMAPSTTGMPAGAAPTTGLPPGAASVLAARSGLDGPIAYVPIQPVVVPRPWRAPLPPDPKLPEAPQLNTFVNAFSPPAPPRGARRPAGDERLRPDDALSAGHGVWLRPGHGHADDAALRHESLRDDESVSLAANAVRLLPDAADGDGRARAATRDRSRPTRSIPTRRR